MEALYNKYRPQIFEDVVGQEHIERTIKNAIASKKISHAYMFTGPRGTGKTTTARLLAKSLLCSEGPTPDPDGTCEECQLIANGDHPDVYELDAASRTGVENVREEIIGKVDYAPTRGSYKVYIIDEVHMLSTAAFNALLKTLEEPPAHVVFIMCTTDPQKIPETILSRCQRFDFRRISSEEMVSRLGAICEMEGIEFDGDALDLIAHRAQGGMRDALTSLEQLIAFGDGQVSSEVAERLLGSLDSSDLADIVKAIGTRDVAECFNWTASYMETGADLVQFVGDLTKHIRDMYVMSLAGADVALDVTEAGRRELEVELSWYGSDRLSRMLEVLGDLTQELKTSTNQRLSFEIALTRMIRPESDITLSALYERVENLERALRSGAASGNAMPSAAPSSVGNKAADTPRDAKPEQSASIGSASKQSAGDEASAGPSTSQIGEMVESDGKPQAAYNGASASLDASASQIWNSTIAHLKKVGPAYGVIFMNTEVRIDDGVLMIEFAKGNDFSFKAAQKQDAQEALMKAFERAGHPGIKYKIVQSKGERSESHGPSRSVQSNEAPVTENEPAVDEQARPESAPQAQPAPGAQARSTAVAQAQSEPVAQPSSTESSQQPSSADQVQNTSPEPAPWEDYEPGEVPSDLPQKEADAAPAPNSAQSDDNEMQDMLTSVFGEGVKFEEIEE